MIKMIAGTLGWFFFLMDFLCLLETGNKSAQGPSNHFNHYYIVITFYKKYPQIFFKKNWRYFSKNVCVRLPFYEHIGCLWSHYDFLRASIYYMGW